LRISAATLSAGAAVEAGATVAQATSGRRAVTVQAPASLLPQVHAGDGVAVTLPDGGRTAGTVTRVGAVTQSGSASTAAVVITLAGDAGGALEDAQVR